MSDTPQTPTLPEARECSEIVYARGDVWLRHPRNCSKRVTTEHEGKPYCKIHDPERVKARRAAAFTKYETESAQRIQASRYAAYGPDLVAALRNLLAAYNGILAAHEAEQGDSGANPEADAAAALLAKVEP